METWKAKKKLNFHFVHLESLNADGEILYRSEYKSISGYTILRVE